MQFSLIALLGLSSAVAFAAPTAEAEAAALPYDSAPLEIRNGGQWACCPQGSKKGCSSCQRKCNRYWDLCVGWDGLLTYGL